MRALSNTPHLIVAALLLASPALAASAPEGADSIWTIRTENDSISTLPKGSDQNYTAGNQIGWTSGGDSVPDGVKNLSQTLYGSGSTRVGLGLSQQFFTPKDKTTSTPNPLDRPYAGYLAVTGSLMHDSENTRDLLAFSLGVIGPWAQAKETQDTVHRLLHDQLAHGWSHQLPNEAAIELLEQRTWRVGLVNIGPFETDILPSVAAGVGTVRDYVQGSMVLRIGHGLDADFGPSRINPGISGGDAFTDSDRVAWYVFAGANGQAIARDAFLDGNLFTRSAHVQRVPLVGEMEGGLAIIWRGARFTYSQTWQTQEFRHQGGGLFSFGSLTLSVRF